MFFLFALYPLIVFILVVIIVLLGGFIASASRAEQPLSIVKSFVALVAVFVWGCAVIIEFMLLSWVL